jgi:tetratricopeptide (TPR) repeat protein
MPPAEARELLLKIASRIGNQADEIARLCGYLPLALRVAASLLEENRNLSVADYARRLRDERQRLEMLQREDQSVAASLGLSYELLGEELRRLWRALAIFTATFELGGAAAVLKLERGAAQDAISKLVRYSLVDWIEQTARYRLHDLARLFAGRQLSAAERAAVSQRHAAHYCRVLAEANGLYMKGGEAIKRGLDLLDAEWSNIQAGQGWAVEHAEPNRDAVKLCIEYPDAGAHVLNLRQHPRERIRWLEEMLTASRRLKQRSYEGGALGNLGTAYQSLGDYRRAIDFHEQFLAIAREIGDRDGEGAALGNLGLAYYSLGDYRRAIDFHEQRLAIAHEIGDRHGEGQALGNLGAAYYSLGDYRRAIDFQEQGLAIAREIGDRRGEGYALGNLGIAYNDLGDYRRAIDFHEQFLAIAREIGDRHGEGIALGNLGGAYNDLGDYRRAIDFHEQRLAIAREISDRDGEGTALGSLGIAYDSRGSTAGPSNFMSSASSSHARSATATLKA